MYGVPALLFVHQASRVVSPSPYRSYSQVCPRDPLHRSRVDKDGKQVVLLAQPGTHQTLNLAVKGSLSLEGRSYGSGLSYATWLWFWALLHSLARGELPPNYTSPVFSIKPLFRENTDEQGRTDHSRRAINLEFIISYHKHRGMSV